MKLLTLLLLFSTPCLAASEAPASTVRIYEKAGKFHLELCQKKCELLGNPAGYTKAEIEHWQSVQPATLLENAAIGGSVALVVIAITFIVFMPVTATAVGFAALLGLAFSFPNHPQTKSQMTNKMYGEFMARPEMVGSLKKFLTELDSGAVTSEQNPRILSGPSAAKQDPAATESGAPKTDAGTAE
jgi:hypothetical protein